MIFVIFLTSMRFLKWSLLPFFVACHVTPSAMFVVWGCPAASIFDFQTPGFGSRMSFRSSQRSPWRTLRGPLLPHRQAKVPHRWFCRAAWAQLGATWFQNVQRLIEAFLFSMKMCVSRTREQHSSIFRPGAFQSRSEGGARSSEIAYEQNLKIWAFADHVEAWGCHESLKNGF